MDYDPAWPQLFDNIRRRIAPAIEGMNVRIEHVGSTAVPGLAAKPLIDLDVVVRKSRDVEAVGERLASIGYVPEGDLGVAGREAFACPPDGLYHHLYVVVDGNAAHRNHIDFRDYLRKHPEEARRYADQKREVAYLLDVDREAYVEAKSGVVQEILKRARGGD